MPQTRISAAAYAALSPEEKQAVMLNSRTQMILDLIQAAALPLDLLTVASLQLAQEHLIEALEKATDEKSREGPEKVHELYLASNMLEAAKGGSKKIIFDGK